MLSTFPNPTPDSKPVPVISAFPAVPTSKDPGAPTVTAQWQLNYYVSPQDGLVLQNVMLGNTGHRLGHVEDVLFDRGRLIAVVIRPDGFFKRDVVLPISFINRADDLALFADLTESDIEQLKPFVDAEEPAG